MASPSDQTPLFCRLTGVNDPEALPWELKILQKKLNELEDERKELRQKMAAGDQSVAEREEYLGYQVEECEWIYHEIERRKKITDEDVEERSCILGLIVAGVRYWVRAGCEKVWLGRILDHPEMSLLKRVGELIRFDGVDDDDKKNRASLEELWEMLDKEREMMIAILKKIFSSVEFKYGKLLTLDPDEEDDEEVTHGGEEVVDGKQWIGGTLQHWLDHSEALIVDVLRMDKGGMNLVETRLNATPRLIIRGLLTKLRMQHSSGQTHGDLRLENVILNHKLEVSFIDGQNGGADDLSKKKDYEGVANIISEMFNKAHQKEMLKTVQVADDELLPDAAEAEATEAPTKSIPKDVQHLLGLLEGAYQKHNEDLIYYHSCLWTPFEVISNVSFIRIKMYATSNLSKEQREDIGVAKVDWMAEVMKHKWYGSALEKWVEKIDGQGCILDPLSEEGRKRMSETPILSFFWMCFAHNNQVVKANYKSGKGAELKKMLKLERDLFIFFPLFLPEFMERTIKYDFIKEIYKKDF